MEDPGEGPWDPPPPLFLDQSEARRAEKNFLQIALPPLSKGLDDHHPPPPLYLKVWIRHCGEYEKLFCQLNSFYM